MKKIAKHSSSIATTAAPLSVEVLTSVEGGLPKFKLPKGKSGRAAEGAPRGKNPLTSGETGQSFWGKVGDSAIFGTGFAGTGLLVDNLFGPDDEATAQMVPPLPAL